MRSLFVRRLTIIDFAFLDPIWGLSGESWIVDIEISGQLDEQGMLFDFGHLKKQAKAYIESHYDHKLIVATQDKQLKIQQDSQQLQLDYQYQQKTLSHISPASAVCLVDAKKISPTLLATQLAQQLMHLMPKNVYQVKVQLAPENIDGAFYQYCHGLKKHQGDCQRIAHGHRSKIEIYCNGKRDFIQEKAWCEDWKSIYIGTIADCLNPQASQLHFAYQANQGTFELQIPASDCCLIETESTVENIADFISKILIKKNPQNQYQVHAFEGVDKGATA